MLKQPTLPGFFQFFEKITFTQQKPFVVLLFKQIPHWKTSAFQQEPTEGILAFPRLFIVKNHRSRQLYKGYQGNKIHDTVPQSENDCSAKVFSNNNSEPPRPGTLPTVCHLLLQRPASQDWWSMVKQFKTNLIMWVFVVMVPIIYI